MSAPRVPAPWHDATPADLDGAQVPDVADDRSRGIVMVVRDDGQDPAIDPTLAGGGLAHLITHAGITPARLFRHTMTGCRGITGHHLHGDGCPLLESLYAGRARR